jgi:ABC-type multidrug transport system ATPase subunit
VVLSKWLFTDPEVLILDEPTRGIDVGAKYEIYTIINELAGEGKGILVISSEMPELLGICDRIYVMNEGRIVGEMPTEATRKRSCAPSCAVTTWEETSPPKEHNEQRPPTVIPRPWRRTPSRQYPRIRPAVRPDRHHGVLSVHDRRRACSAR